VFDVVTDEAMRGQGIATALVARLLARAWDRGARVAYLQVDADNAPAIAVYRRYGFSTIYTYHYCGRAGACA
jgi:ribosomal protein S18 acetylase RimI-like enzyme